MINATYTYPADYDPSLVTVSSIMGTGLVSRDMLEPLPEPKVVKTKPLTLEQQCAHAMERLRVSIEAQASWDLKQMASRTYEVDNSHGL